MKKVSLILTVLLFSGALYAQEITLDHVTNTWDEAGTLKLIPNCETTFYLRFNNNSGDKIGGFTSGFELYTPGASNISTTVTADTLDIGIPWTDRFNLGPKINYSGCDGMYPEIVGFSGAGLPNAAGFEIGFNEVAVSITTVIGSGERDTSPAGMVPIVLKRLIVFVSR